MVAVTFLVQTVSSVGVALAVLVAGWLLNRSAEHKKWLRETRLEAYTDVIKRAADFASKAAIAGTGLSPAGCAVVVAELKEMLNEFDIVLERVRLVGSSHQVEHADALMLCLDAVADIEFGEQVSPPEALRDFVRMHKQLDLFGQTAREEIVGGFWARR